MITGLQNPYQSYTRWNEQRLIQMITSLQNPAIKNVVKLSKSKERSQQQIFVIEGARELSLAMQGNYKIDKAFVCREMFEKTKYPEVLNTLSEEDIFEITNEVFAKIAYRENSDGDRKSVV